MERSCIAVTGAHLPTRNTAFQHGKRDEEAEQPSALTLLLLQGWDVATRIPAGLEAEEHPSLAPTSSPPSLPALWCLWMGKGEGSLWSSQLGSSCAGGRLLRQRRSAAATRYQPSDAAVWKRLQWPGVPSGESCDTTSLCFSCLLAQRWHLHPCFSDWSFPAPVGDVLPVCTTGNVMSSGQQTAAAKWEGDAFVHS